MNRETNHNDLTPLLIVTLVATAIFFVVLFTSCSRAITPFEAANGKAKCGRHLK